MRLRNQYTPGAYDKCIACQFRGHGCDGPRTTSMPIDRWCMLMRRLKEEGRYTNDEVSEVTGISSATVEKIMAVRVDTDLRASTMSAIEAMLFGSSGTYPCPLELIPEQEDGAALRQSLSDALERIADLEAIIEEKDRKLQRREETIAEQNATMNRLHAIIARKEDDIARKDARIAKMMDKMLGE